MRHAEEPLANKQKNDWITLGARGFIGCFMVLMIRWLEFACFVLASISAAWRLCAQD